MLWNALHKVDKAGSLKDDVLARLSSERNTAQFVSFSPGEEPFLRRSALRHGSPTETTLPSALKALWDSAQVHSLNVRSFKLGSPSGNPFFYGITDLKQVEALVRQLAAEDYYTIVNETIDVDDGGVSGVYESGVLEFAPGDTPRAVEGNEHVSLPVELGLRLLECVYGFDVDLGPLAGRRVEFSIHPLHVGTTAGHVLFWEDAPSSSPALESEIVWPNPFSRRMGDKVFGLLVAHLAGFQVPFTHVFSRSLAPFSFGTATGTGETWLRTAPFRRAPGRYTTQRGWIDPFALMHEEDPQAKSLASVLAQDGVDSQFSGAAYADPGTHALIEGVSGFGDNFMLGTQSPQRMPAFVENDIQDVSESLTKLLGPVTFEWAHDGQQTWILQLHRAKVRSDREVVVAGNPPNGWLTYTAGGGLDVLRALIERAICETKGIQILGKVGLTSHVGDLLRESGVPAKIVS